MSTTALDERRRGGAVEETDVYAALSAVIDPELDEDVVGLGFVAAVRVEGRAVSVELRLPTYWCAPNFSWLMASDAREAVLAMPGVEQVEVKLVDHHAGDVISAGVSAGRSFEEAFAAEADGDLQALRTLFRRKAFLVRQGRALRTLPRDAVAGATLGDLPDLPHTHAYLEVRRELGLDCSPHATALTDAAGRAVRDVEAHLRRVRMVDVSLRSNGAMCRGLLQTRYGKVSP